MAFGAGYAQAEDRLFLMDVLRHYGEGTLAGFLGPSCDVRADGPRPAAAVALHRPRRPRPRSTRCRTEYGAQGALAKSLIDNFVAGVNAYIDATRTNPALLPADYAAGACPAAAWTDADVVAIAGLIGGIFGKGGGSEVANAALLQYLQKQLGTAAGAQRVPAVQGAERPGGRRRPSSTSPSRTRSPARSTRRPPRCPTTRRHR